MHILTEKNPGVKLIHHCGQVVDLNVADPNTGFTSVVLPLDIPEDSGSIAPVLTYLKTNDAWEYFISLGIWHEGGKVEIVYLFPGVKKGLLPKESIKGYVIRKIGELVYQYLHYNGFDIDQHSRGLRASEPLTSSNAFNLHNIPGREYIYQFIHEQKMELRVLGFKPVEKAGTIVPRVTNHYDALFNGIKARVSIKASIFCDQEDKFSAPREFTIRPAWGIPKVDNGYEFKFTEMGISDITPYPFNQKLVASWLESIGKSIC